MATLAYLIDKIAKRLRLEGGTVTQTYSEDAIVMAIQHKFDVLFDEYWLPQFMTQQEAYTLDGTSGSIVGDLSSKIKRFQDIRYVHSSFSRRPLGRAPDSVRIDHVRNPCVQPVSDKAKVFRIIPLSTVGQVALTYRTKPDDFEGEEDEVDIDPQLMILGTCYDMLADDGLNPGAEDKFKSAFDARVKQLTESQHNLPMAANEGISGWGSTFIVQPIQLPASEPSFEDLTGEF